MMNYIILLLQWNFISYFAKAFIFIHDALLMKN